MDRNPGFKLRPLVDLQVGAVNNLPGHLERLGAGRPVVLIDAALGTGEVGDQVRKLLPEAPLVTAEPGEPTFASIARTAAKIRDSGADALVAIGGGSTIDTGKISRGLLAAGVEDPAELGVDLPHPPMPMVAVPTTAGTGTEMGHSAIALDPAKNDKVGIRIPALAPDVAIDDPALTLGLPPSLTAYTGCDALAQALLAYVSAGGVAISGQLALRAVDLIFAALPRAVENGRNLDAREQMMIGSACSAIAMFTAPMNFACEHAFAEPLGSLLKAHHGHLVAAFLPGVAEYNIVALEARYAEVARYLRLVDSTADGATAAAALVDKLRELVVSLGIPPLGKVAESQPLEPLVDCVLANELFVYNPTEIPRDSATAIVEGAWHGSFRVGA